MAMTIDVRVVSAEGSIYEGVATMVVAPGEMGELGILPRHAPLLTGLRPGELRIINGENTEYLFVNGGMLEIQPDVVTVLADSAERATDIDEAKALAAKQAAEARLAGNLDQMDYAAAQGELLAQIARLKAVQRLREQGLLR
ncbi:F0F1 ATP synthase subunit epsilon [Acidithiobacillus thiooxidans]|jgi:F-type H+-transporting ATPase subunit epsilon|uniref:ATP synthase epsilon chain n=2 Tax=Acidithiobacillus thiooxidans TaxID=930 RepID=A0A1C2JHI3_ACITH|nr:MULTISPECIES: F0F1 ATP synthase subunit epsilon [Acidithiobacillus]MBE7567596.1 F0F1 ATP synthase subunit epsilon [Acidithiobacillus sp. HP-11]MBU2742562.1 F0F1 ATP synthase subunit epsilon [Acidithiobacillus albertensis]MBU2751754.1 F0F1 ATP synthase subunit epsilon [Acidithiobacillus thiooxidans]MBU2792033.1 F0F1 ATP synthase subunit epsilon [Acidithiobacillus thiooxidans]MBU2810011.1 F0F1 ATP synthase subunit epsilon [Acidithiobacillus thiooxidans]